ncbi:MAG: hypothetical protein K9M11_02465 [Candidatus Pacebacteria bacterium]|nr:hypothetical protein [Candidatus Paceibacterota bacterium]
MNQKPKNKTLLILGAISLVCSRTVFFFVNDPEGPNLLIVVVLAAIIFAVFLFTYWLYHRINRMSQ